ncbi:MAG TPA: hypothetical protein VGB00_18750 [Pyrinomonadaceae bacterium]|jgi:hypothetical protein
MKKRILLVLSLILAATGFVFAQTGARKTVTNADLEKFRQKRVQAEADYRANYKRLGLPSPEELEEREAERRAWHAEYSQKVEAERAQNENYFLARADELRLQINSIDAQINYLRGQAGARQSPYKGGTIVYGGGIVFGGYSSGHDGSFRGGATRGFRQNRAGVGLNTQTVRNYAGSFPTAGDIRNQIYGTYPQLNRPPRRFGRADYGGGYVVSGGSYGVDDLTYLERQRAGLLAEWRILEEEARRAGVRID